VTRVRVTVDPTRCAASQTCIRIAPRHFELIGAQHARATQQSFPDEELGLLAEAEDSCPTGAIRVEPTGGAT
jgi:ferredoxin